MDHVKKLLALLLLCSVASAQTYYNKTTINPATPFSFGTSITPSFGNVVTGTTATVTANSTTFTCASNCGNLAVGKFISGSDGVHNLWPALAGLNNAVILTIVGSTVTTSIPTSASTTPGTYAITVGSARWDTTSSGLINTMGAYAYFGGGAAKGNSSWAQQYFSGYCDTRAWNCWLSDLGSQNAVSFTGGRSSDGISIMDIKLGVQDNTSIAHNWWTNYWQTELLSGVNFGRETHALESTVFNFNSHDQKLDPYHYDVGNTIENLRLTSGQAGFTDTMYNASDAISIIPINSTGYETAILVATGALDESTMAHPPALALPAGAKGYGVTWYEATGYTSPAWNLYATNTTSVTNTFALNDNNATVSIDNDAGTGSVIIGSGALATSGTHTATFSGTGLAAGLDVGSTTVNDPISSGTTAYMTVSHFGTPTLTAASPLTLTTAATLAIDGCPTASTNITISSNGCQSLRVLAGTAVFSGGIGASAIGTFTPSTGAFTTVSATGAITSTLATGTAPFTVASTTNVANLNASLLNGTTFAAPAAIGSGTPAAGSFTTLNATGLITPASATGVKGTVAADEPAAGSVGEVASINCLVAGSAAAATTITVTIATPAVVTWSSHTFVPSTGLASYTCPINFTSTGALPTGLVVGTNYYIDGATVSGDTFQISDTAAHALAGTNHVATSGSQSGTQAAYIGALGSTGTVFGGAALNLTAGDWDCSYVGTFEELTSLTTTRFTAGINTSVAAPVTGNANVQPTASQVIGAASPNVPSPIVRENVSSTTAIYGVNTSTFSGGTMNEGGLLRCRRMR